MVDAVAEDDALIEPQPTDGLTEPEVEDVPAAENAASAETMDDSAVASLAGQMVTAMESFDTGGTDEEPSEVPVLTDPSSEEVDEDLGVAA